MLKLNDQQNPQQQKLIDSVLKHKVRNLRAKVQSLLPIHLCQKIQKRTRHIEKLLMKKILSEQQQQQSRQQSSSVDFTKKLQKGWKHTLGEIKKQNSFAFFSTYTPSQQIDSHKQKHQSKMNSHSNSFFEDLQTPKKKADNKAKQDLRQIKAMGYRFEKLTEQQIQQIQEDRLYYLGQEKHIKAYESYIKEKHTAKVTMPIADDIYKLVSKSFIALGTLNNLRINNKPETNVSIEDEDQGKYMQYVVGLKQKRQQKQQQLRKNSLLDDGIKQKYVSILESKNTKNQLRYMRSTTHQKPQWKHNDHLTKINEESYAKRILMSMQLKTKQFKVQQNFIKIKKNRIQMIEKQNLKQKQKIISAQQKKRKIHTQAGQIVQLTQKLRRKCIQRRAFKFNNNRQEASFIQQGNGTFF